MNKKLEEQLTLIAITIVGLMIFVFFYYLGYTSAKEDLVKRCEGVMYKNRFECQSINGAVCETKLNNSGLFCVEKKVYWNVSDGNYYDLRTKQLQEEIEHGED